MRTADGTSAAAVCHFLSHSALPPSFFPLALSPTPTTSCGRRSLRRLARSFALPSSLPPSLPPRRARLRCDSLSNPPKRTPTPPRFLTSSRSSLSVPPPRESSYLYFGRTCLRANDLNRNMEQIHNSDPRGKRSGLCVNSVLGSSREKTLYFRSCWILCIFCPA